jgi:hypothetical protein
MVYLILFHVLRHFGMAQGIRDEFNPQKIKGKQGIDSITRTEQGEYYVLDTNIIQ